MNRLSIGVLIFLGVTFCGKNQMEFSDIEALRAKCPKLVYPYRLDSLTSPSLVARVEQLKIGERYQRVLEKLGFPSEINLTYSKDDWSKKIGFSFVFLLQRDRPEGSVVEKNEKAIRIHFDSSRVISRIDIPIDPG